MTDIHLKQPIIPEREPNYIEQKVKKKKKRKKRKRN